MARRATRYVHALGPAWLTALYDPVVALTTRERRFKSQLVRQADLEPGMDVLDVACGTGTLALMILRREPAAEVTGIDGDELVLGRARRKALRARVKLRLDRGLAQELPYRDGSFDRVFSSLFFHHLLREDKQRALREILRVLRPGGELHLADWDRASDLAMRLLFLPVRLLDGFRNTEDHVRGLLPSLLEGAGLVDVSRTERLRTMVGTLGVYRARRPT